MCVVVMSADSRPLILVTDVHYLRWPGCDLHIPVRHLPFCALFYVLAKAEISDAVVRLSFRYRYQLWVVLPALRLRD